MSASPVPTSSRDETRETTIVAAVHGEEAARATSFGRAVALFCVVGIFLMAIRRGITDEHRIRVALTCLVQGSVAAWVWYRSRDPSRYSRTVFRFFGIVTALSALSFILAVGIFSPMPSIVVLGFAFFGQAEDKQVMYPVAIGVIVAYAIGAVLVTLDVLHDPGVFTGIGVMTESKVSIGLTTCLTMLIALLQAHWSRRAMLEAIARSNEAIRVAQTREAQLAEAKENFNLAVRERGGRLSGSIVGRFRLGEIVGRGAMGEVYAAEDEANPGKAAAVKVLRMEDSEDDTAAARFVREAEIALKVRGPNLVEVYEAGTATDGSAFIAMELLRGRDLAAMLRDRETMPLLESVALVEHAARGLEVLHSAGVIHRDLKPQNLFLSDGPPQIWKILDYGVSKLVGASTMTEAMLVGTPGYMSPEQAEGRPIDPRSDVFALGVIAYRVLTGRRPFSGADTPQILYQIVHGDPVRPSELMPSLPQEVDSVLGVALAKQPEDRFASPSDFALALRAAVTERRTKGPRRGTRTWRREPGTLTMPRLPPTGAEPGKDHRKDVPG